MSRIQNLGRQGSAFTYRELDGTRRKIPAQAYPKVNFQEGEIHHTRTLMSRLNLVINYRMGHDRWRFRSTRNLRIEQNSTLGQIFRRCGARISSAANILKRGGHKPVAIEWILDGPLILERISARLTAGLF